MSFELIERIKIENNEVFIKGASNNVTPRDYRYWKSNYFTKLINESPELYQKELLETFWTGEFQSKSNSVTHLDEAIAIDLVRAILSRKNQLVKQWESTKSDDYVLELGLSVLKNIKSFPKGKLFTFVQDKSSEGFLKENPLYLNKVNKDLSLQFYDNQFDIKPMTFTNPYRALYRIGFNAGLFSKPRSFNMIELDRLEFKKGNIKFDRELSYMVSELKEFVSPYPTKDELRAKYIGLKI
jgi:hypothetical protein|tara:strand:- start:3588 stop:4307 length:720 start_codon:yes stop_codon:yes gene_type:complete